MKYKISDHQQRLHDGHDQPEHGIAVRLAQLRTAAWKISSSISNADAETGRRSCFVAEHRASSLRQARRS